MGGLGGLDLVPAAGHLLQRSAGDSHTGAGNGNGTSDGGWGMGDSPLGVRACGRGRTTGAAGKRCCVVVVWCPLPRCFCAASDKRKPLAAFTDTIESAH